MRVPLRCASFVVGWAVIAVFLRWLKTRGLAPFGWYRVALGAAVLWFVPWSP